MCSQNKIMKLLRSQLNSLGLKPGDTIMMHASMRAMGKEVTNPNEVIQSIIEVIGPTGKLMIYAGCELKYEAGRAWQVYFRARK